MLGVSFEASECTCVVLEFESHVVVVAWGLSLDDVTLFESSPVFPVIALHLYHSHSTLYVFGSSSHRDHSDIDIILTNSS